MAGAGKLTRHTCLLFCFDMASPQLENGATKIANEILEILAKYPLSSYEFRVLLFIFRKTYGWHKLSDWICLDQFVKGTGIKDTHICRTIKLLVDQNIITKRGNRSNPEYGFQKNYDKWLKLSNKKRTHSPITKRGKKNELPIGVIQITNRGKMDYQKGLDGLPIGGDTIVTTTNDTSTKDTITIATPSVAENKQVVEIIDAFKTTGLNPLMGYNRSDQRNACKELLKAYGLEKVLGAIKYAASIAGQQYAPVITTPQQLKEKIGALSAHLKRSKNNDYSVVKIS
jgi:phage replication O-like protein O